jgi:hypothetical protein
MKKMVVFLIQQLLAEGVISDHSRAVGVRLEDRPRNYAFIRTHEGREGLTGHNLFGNFDIAMLA